MSKKVIKCNYPRMVVNNILFPTRMYLVASARFYTFSQVFLDCVGMQDQLCVICLKSGLHRSCIAVMDKREI